MPESGKQTRAVDMRRHAERRVHKNGRWRNVLRKEVVDLLGVEAG